MFTSKEIRFITDLTIIYDDIEKRTKVKRFKSKSFIYIHHFDKSFVFILCSLKHHHNKSYNSNFVYWLFLIGNQIQTAGVLTEQIRQSLARKRAQPPMHVWTCDYQNFLDPGLSAIHLAITVSNFDGLRRALTKIILKSRQFCNHGHHVYDFLYYHIPYVSNSDLQKYSQIVNEMGAQNKTSKSLFFTAFQRCLSEWKKSWPEYNPRQDYVNEPSLIRLTF